MNSRANTSNIQVKPKLWLITGVAGFIGSNLLEYLLIQGYQVVGLDNFSTGFQYNLDEVRCIVGDQLWKNFKFIEGDIRDIKCCQEVTKDIDVILHQAALASVSRSINDPITSNAVNIDGFLNILKSAVDNKVKRVVYASSSSVYGDEVTLPKRENLIGNQLSPYAITKYTNELYAKIFSKLYNIELIGLRYFNVFGPRQDPYGGYAAVIPLWFNAFLKQVTPIIYGDGTTSRDFCYIDNVVQMNVLSGITNNFDALNKVYNVAYGERTSLNQLFAYLQNIINPEKNILPIYKDSRAGDIQHSLADISLAKKLLAYTPKYDVISGLKKSLIWYKQFVSKSK